MNMPSAPPFSKHQSSGSSRKDHGIASRMRSQRIHRELAGVSVYPIPRERGLSVFLILSLALFTVATLLGALIPKEEELPPMIEVDLGFEGVENEPPPLGEPDAGAGEMAPEPLQPLEPEPEPPVEPEAELQPPVPEPVLEPEPVPEPEREPESEKAPEPEPQFEVPKEEPAPKPEPKPKEKPKPVVKARSKPREIARENASTSSTVAGSGQSEGRAGVRGSPGGTRGGRGGGRGDFISTPQPQYDSTAKQRRYEGRGLFVIRYVNGRIVSVRAAQSTGVPYLDSRTIAWITSRWRVKKDTSGAATLPITWRLR